VYINAIYGKLQSEEIMNGDRTNKTDAVKNATENVISNLTIALGREPSFREFIESRIEKYSYAEIERLYNFYEDAWTSTGRKAEDSIRVFHSLFDKHEQPLKTINEFSEDSHFQNPKEETNNTMLSYPEKEKTIKKETNKQIKLADKQFMFFIVVIVPFFIIPLLNGENLKDDPIGLILPIVVSIIIYCVFVKK